MAAVKASMANCASGGATRKRSRAVRGARRAAHTRAFVHAHTARPCSRRRRCCDRSSPSRSSRPSSRRARAIDARPASHHRPAGTRREAAPRNSTDCPSCAVCVQGVTKACALCDFACARFPPQCAKDFVVIIGAGPAGLATDGAGCSTPRFRSSCWSARRGRRVVAPPLPPAAPAGTPRYSALPYFPFPDHFPDFVSAQDLADYYEGVAAHMSEHIRYGVEVVA